MDRPKVKDLKDIDLRNVIEICEEQMDLIEQYPEHQCDDLISKFDGYIRDSIVTALYGKDVGKWVCSKM